MGIRTYGPNAVDWEERVDLDRLRRQRLARLEEALERSHLGALLTFDFHNIRYMTSTHIGTWAMDKLIRFALLPRGGRPVVWDFGSAARHHQLYNSWLDGRPDDPESGRARAGISTLRGAFHPRAGIAEEVARKIRHELEEHGLAGEPLGVDVVEMPVLAALEAAGLDVVDGQQVFLDARRIKTGDEIALLATAVALVGDPAFFDILHSFNGYRTCYYRTFAVGSASSAMRDAYRRCRDYMDAAIALVKPGSTTADIVSVWPRATEFGFPSEEAAFALQYGHGVGLSIWEKPIFSRLVSLEHPEVIETGMVFALETYWPASDGWSAARIEEEVVVTDDGCEVITKFPAEELLVAGHRYWAMDGPLPTLREAESHRNRR